jgi:glyoxylate carboligase
MNASDVLVERLMEWGVDTIFGLPGDGIDGVFEALRKHKDRTRFIHVRHEESAALMACAYAKFTGRIGVCIHAAHAREDRNRTGSQARRGADARRAQPVEDCLDKSSRLGARTGLERLIH